MKLYNAYRKKYAGGGPVDNPRQANNAVLGQAIGTAASVGSGLIDATDNGNDLGYQKPGTIIGKSALSGAATGATFGPIGAGIGAALGAGIGLLKSKQQQREQDALRSKIKLTRIMNENATSQSVLATNPELTTGNQHAQYFAHGGGIHIKSSHKGRFTAYKARTGKTTEEALHSSDPHVRQMANFARNAAKWYHKADGGPLTDGHTKPKPQGLKYVAFPFSEGGNNSSTYTVDLTSKVRVPSKNSRGYVNMYNVHRPDGTMLTLNDEQIPGEYLDPTLKNNSAKETYGLNGKLQRVDSLYKAPGADDFSIHLPHYEEGGTLVKKYLQGGNVANQETLGGTVTPLSSTAGEVNGPSHSNGGVKLPESGAEVEGGETTAGNFVFSDRLGFAKLHKPIAAAIGKIEKKPQTQDRLNALRLLKQKEQQLAIQQEQFKKQHGITN